MFRSTRTSTSGKITANDLLEQYTKAEPTEQLKRSNEVINEVQSENRRQLRNPPTADEMLRLWIVLAQLFGALFGLAIGHPYRLSHRQLHHRTAGASHHRGARSRRQGRSRPGNRLESKDEIGTLAQTFRNMVIYFKEMATVSEAIAGGDLSVESRPAPAAIPWPRAFSR